MNQANKLQITLQQTNVEKSVSATRRFCRYVQVCIPKAVTRKWASAMAVQKAVLYVFLIPFVHLGMIMERIA